MATKQIREEVERGISRLETLRDEVRVRLHLASLDAKKEWDETIEPRVLELEDAARSLTESSPTATKVKELVTKLEEFLSDLREPPESRH